ncbi:MAG: hypothetical protein U0T82_07275 [Bacteroidales bacterium]
MHKSLKYFLLTIFFLALAFLLFSYLPFYECLSIALFMLVSYKLMAEINQNLSIKNLIAFIAVLQWLIGAILGYEYMDRIQAEYLMRIPRDQYFSFVFPATLAMLAGLYLIPTRGSSGDLLLSLSGKKLFRKGLILVLIGFVSGFFPQLGFAGYLLASLRYVGLFYIFLSGHWSRNIWLVVIFGSLVFFSFGYGLFHELLLWGTFFMMVYYISKNSSLFFRLSTITAGFLLLLALQVSKQDIRDVAWNGNIPASQRAVMSLKMLTGRVTGEEKLFSDEVIPNLVVRINQGWIISAIMDYIPAEKDFVRGETVRESFEAAIYPRFLKKDKAKSGGQRNMLLYAGITLNQNTSMDISQVGEAWANYGMWGGILMMFCMGLFMGVVFWIIELRALKNPELILWIPFLFLQVVKAETSLVTMLNHIVKAALITWFFFLPPTQYLLSPMWDEPGEDESPANTAPAE